MKRLAPLPGEHFLYDGKIYKVIKLNRAYDEVILEEFEEKIRGAITLSLFFYACTQVWKIKDAAQFVNRSPRSIYRYEKDGRVKVPNRYSDSIGRQVRFYSREDIMELREMVADIHQGSPNKTNKIINNSVPDEFSLKTMLRERYGNG